MSPSDPVGTSGSSGVRRSHKPPVAASTFVVQAAQLAQADQLTQAFHAQLPHYPFQPLPPPNGHPPFRYDLSKLLSASQLQAIKDAGSVVFDTVGDTGDFRGRQQDFVADMMKLVSENSADGKKSAFMYHLGDVVYFAGDIDKYGDNFYETYKEYPAFIVSIPGNHDCQPDDPQDGPVDPHKFPLDGWVKNFMSTTPGQLGSLKTGANRTQMDLPNVYWTFTTPFATIVGLFSNVGETEGEIHQDQIDWFKSELAAADPNLALIVAVHHPPFSGDTEHTGSSAVDRVLFESFQDSGRYPDLILSGHVHNYQRFTKVVQTAHGSRQIPCVVAGAGGYTRLGRLQKINGKYPDVPLQLQNGLTLEEYDHDNFGFLRLEVSKATIVGTYFSDRYSSGAVPDPKQVESFEVDLVKRTVRTLTD